jgi:hypothetical protein
MTEQGKPLSRRDRRAVEARAAAGAPDATESLDTADSEAPTVTGGLSRRDRRRLERAQRPMETWTAEEEMIATGQLPAMTPEVIAEQERLAQEKARQAELEAAAAAKEFGLTASDAARTEPEPTQPVRTSAFSRAADADLGSADDAVAQGDADVSDLAPDAEPAPDAEVPDLAPVSDPADFTEPGDEVSAADD